MIQSTKLYLVNRNSRASSVWTLKFESKYTFFKDYINNFKDVACKYRLVYSSLGFEMIDLKYIKMKYEEISSVIVPSHSLHQTASVVLTFSFS